VADAEDARRAGEAIVDMGAEAALVKGGHVPGDDVVDTLVTAEAVETLRHPRVDTDATHGSGCTLSSAIATRLAHGDDLPAAVRTGIDLLARAVRYNLDVGAGPGAVHHAVSIRDRAERQPTAERVAETVREFVRRDVSALVPEVGMNVVGATPYAEVPAECAAVEGRLTRTLDGVEPNRGVRFGASTHLARFLLAAREYDPDLGFVVNCRHDDDVLAALDALDGEVVTVDPGIDAPEEYDVEALVEAAFAAADGTPAAVAVDHAVGIEGTVELLAPDAATLTERTATVLDGLDGE
jgi:hydroxymethylpyrimidine/phosphomethylpyrimidine kinase